MNEPATPLTATGDEIAIALLVHRASDPIDGTVTVRDDAPVPFTGWMQLTRLLSRALDAAR
jgi:hypothetical protein